ncbi:MAG: helix-turn-helix transcriptional regulator [Planctomycetota bacterium]|jgi:predicted DNA-binding transcriptional regulator AlpA
MKAKSKGNSEIVAERYVDIKALSRYTSLPIKTLYEWASVGKIPSIKICRRVLFDLHDIDQVMTSLKRTNILEENVVEKIVGGINGNNI